MLSGPFDSYRRTEPSWRGASSYHRHGIHRCRCRAPVAGSGLGRRSGWWSDRRARVGIGLGGGGPLVMSGWRGGRGMRRTGMGLRLGTLAGRSRRLCGWRLRVGSAGRCLMWGVGVGRTRFTLQRWDCRCWVVDVAETALRLAREKAVGRGVEAEFATADALQLEGLGRRFDTVLDCALFHTFDSEERSSYAASLASVTETGGTLYVLCYSDDGPDTGPHPVSQEDLKTAFTPGAGSNIVAIIPERVRTRFHDADGAPAWLATIRRA